MLRVLLAHENHSQFDRVIAQAIAYGLEEQLGGSAQVTVERMSPTSTVGGYDAYVIGTTLAQGRWLNTTREFVHRNMSTIAQKPTAIYLALTGPMDAETESRVREAVASEQTKHFVASHMPLKIEPNQLRGIGFFTPSHRSSSNRILAWLRKWWAKIFRASRVEHEYAIAGRHFGKRIALQVRAKDL